MKIKVTMDLDVTNQLLHDLFVTALEGGVGYWSLAEKYRWSLGPPDYKEDLEDFKVILIDTVDVDNKRHLVNKAVILRGVQRALAMRDHFSTKVLGWIIDPTGDVADAGDADAIVQLGIFGEVIYD